MISFYLLWTLCYFVLLSWFAKKWPNPIPQADSIGEYPTVTLLIPFRNEMENLDRLTDEILKINYPKLEIILVDDQSEDDSFHFLKRKTSLDPRIKVLQSPGTGKKSALEYGILNAEGEVILCSDADCRFPKNWIQRMITPFANPKIQLVAGPIISEGQTTFFRRFQQIEWSSILLLTQFFFNRNNPLMCSGANLAYRKSAFLEVNGYEGNLQQLSGDDEFLLKKISSRFGKGSCVYLPFSENLVFTAPQSDFSALLNQRVRWAGKWKVHRDFGHALSAIISFIFQLIWLGSFVLLGFEWYGIVVFTIVWTGKFSAEKNALGKVLKCLGVRLSPWDFLKTGLTHPVYVIGVALGTWRGKFVWKGRTN
ncbi:MAG TPA: glycosyltransferase [Algoriphagus sp.]|nr:glycosyltransferase [Algoriphagus sp.]